MNYWTCLESIGPIFSMVLKVVKIVTSNGHNVSVLYHASHIFASPENFNEESESVHQIHPLANILEKYLNGGRCEFAFKILFQTKM